VDAEVPDPPTAAKDPVYPGQVSESDWRDQPLLPDQTEDDLDRDDDDDDRDDALRRDVPPHHGSY